VSLSNRVLGCVWSVRCVAAVSSSPIPRIEATGAVGSPSCVASKLGFGVRLVSASRCGGVKLPDSENRGYGSSRPSALRSLKTRFWGAVGECVASRRCRAPPIPRIEATGAADPPSCVASKLGFGVRLVSASRRGDVELPDSENRGCGSGRPSVLRSLKTRFWGASGPCVASRRCRAPPIPRIEATGAADPPSCVASKLGFGVRLVSAVRCGDVELPDSENRGYGGSRLSILRSLKTRFWGASRSVRCVAAVIELPRFRESRLREWPALRLA
jgi:hypothetical protein